MVSMPIRGRERRGKRAGSSPEPLALLALKEKCVSPCEESNEIVNQSYIKKRGWKKTNNTKRMG